MAASSTHRSEPVPVAATAAEPRSVRASPASREGDRREPGGSPWRQPVVWLGILVFLASIAGCIVTIVLALRVAEPSDPVPAERVFKVPVTRVQP